MLSKKHQLFQPTQKATSPFKLLLTFSNGRGKSWTTWSWKNVSFFLLFFSFSIKSTPFTRSTFSPPENLVLQSAKFKSLPRSNQTPIIFSPQKIRILQITPLSVPTDQVKYSNPTIKKFNFFMNKISLGGEKYRCWVRTQSWTEDLLRSRRIRRCDEW